MRFSSPDSVVRAIVSAAALLAYGYDAAAQSDLADCIAAAKATSLRCWDRCSGSGDRLDRCTSKCESTFQDDKGNCKTGHSGQNSASRAQLSGTQKGGENGCYFGECPTDLKKKIAETHEKVDVDDDPPLKRYEAPRAALTGVCQTVYGWCLMNQTGPVGYPCWCMTVSGVLNGVTVPQR